MGTVGLLALLGWVAAVAMFLWRLRGAGKDPWVRALWFGSVGAFAAMMIAGVTEPAIGYEHSLLLNAQLALLGASAASRGSDAEVARQPGQTEGHFR